MTMLRSRSCAGALLVAAVLALGACAGGQESPAASSIPKITWGDGSTPTASAAPTTPVPTRTTALATATPLTAPPGVDACPSGGTNKRVQGGLPDDSYACLGDRSTKINVASLAQGKPVLINVWASWCQPCINESTHLAAAHRAFGGSVDFYGIDVKDSEADARELLAASGVQYPQLVDPTGLSRIKLRAAALPMTIVLDASGRVVYQESHEFTSGAEIGVLLQDTLGLVP